MWREIARGVHPAVLTESGLRPALRALARRSAVPVSLNVQVPGRSARPGPACGIALRRDGGDEAVLNAIGVEAEPAYGLAVFADAQGQGAHRSRRRGHSER